MANRSRLFCFPPMIYLADELGTVRHLSDSTFRWLNQKLKTFVTAIDRGFGSTENDLGFVMISAEYLLHLIRFSLHDPYQLDVVNCLAVERVQQNIELLIGCQKPDPISEVDIARSQRIKGCIRDIYSTLEECRYQQEGGTSITTGSASSGDWGPFLKSPARFSSDAEREFMTRLRTLYIRVHTEPGQDSIQELNDLFRTTDIDQLTLSEAMTDTVIRSIIYILEVIAERQTQTVIATSSVLDDVTITFLHSRFSAINKPEHLRERAANCSEYREYVYRRIVVCWVRFFRVHTMVKGPPLGTGRPVLETAPGDPPSALWQKLQAMESVDALTEGREKDKCSICLKEKVAKENFGLLDKCVHLFCVECIKEWFEKGFTCPYCRASVSSWTTRDNFMDFKKTIKAS